MAITLEQILKLESRIPRMLKPELILALQDIVQFYKQQAQSKPTSNMEQAVQQLGEIIWRDGKGNNTRLKEMDSTELRIRSHYVNKQVSKLTEFNSGTPWCGLTFRQWQKVFFYYQEKEMPADEYGIYNKLQERLPVIQDYNQCTGYVSNNQAQYFEPEYTKLDEDRG